MMRRSCLALLLLLLLPVAANAQCVPAPLPPDAAPPCTAKYPSWTGELAVLGGNALLGGLSGGILRRVQGGSFREGFVYGVAGGAVIYAGKRIAVERFGGAGLVGREVAAVGASMVRNAGESRDPFERVTLPIGPTWLVLQRTAPRVRLRADLFAAGYTIWAATQPELRFDFGRSLSAGTPVFRARDRLLLVNGDSTHASGVVGGGVIMLADMPQFGRRFDRHVFEHERVHVLQMDQLFLTVTGPVEDRIMARVPGIRILHPYIDVNLGGELMRRLGGAWDDHLRRPWETEAIFLSR